MTDGRVAAGAGVAGAAGVTVAAGVLRGVEPLVRPRLEEQDGHAPQPWFASTFSATAICSSRVAWFAVAAYSPPPCAVQVLGENWSPPW